MNEFPPGMPETNRQIERLVSEALAAGFEIESDVIDTQFFGNRLVLLRSVELRLRLINDRGTLIAAVSRTGESWLDACLALNGAGIQTGDKPLDDVDAARMLLESPNRRAIVRVWNVNPD